MVRIVSWNVNGIRSNIFCEGSLKKSKKIYQKLTECNLKKLIEKYNPDIICFQETKCSEEIAKQFQFAEYPFKYWNESKGEKHRGTGYSGTSIWSKIEPESVDNKFIKDDFQFENKEGRFMIAKFKDFDLINVYVPNSGTNFDYRIQEWDKNIHMILERSIDKPLIYTGDLNVVSEPSDIWNPQILKNKNMNVKEHNGLLKEERDNFSSLIKNIDYVDVFRHLYSDTNNKYTWWDQRQKMRSQNKGRRIDYFLINKRYFEIVKNSIILDDIMGSDHCPIMLELNYIIKTLSKDTKDKKIQSEDLSNMFDMSEMCKK